MERITHGLFYCNNEKLDTMNESIYNRNFSSVPLQNEYLARPSYTRRVLFPIVDCHGMSKTKCETNDKPYSPEKIFNPADSAPFSGWASAIDDDSRLRNIFMTNQKWCDQTLYVPSSKSSLYTTKQGRNFIDEERTIQHKEQLQTQHPFLFRNDKCVSKYGDQKPVSFSRHKDMFGDRMFYNHTRQQLKEVPLKNSR